MARFTLFYTPRPAVARHTQWVACGTRCSPASSTGSLHLPRSPAPESHQSNGITRVEHHMPFSQSVERLPPICSISAANCLRPWPPGRLPEYRAPLSFTSVISRNASSPRTGTSYFALRKAHDAKTFAYTSPINRPSHPYDRHTDAHARGQKYARPVSIICMAVNINAIGEPRVAHRLINHPSSHVMIAATRNGCLIRGISGHQATVLSGHVSARSHVSTM